MTIVETCESNWQEREKFWISQYDNLTNLKDGGGVDYIRTTSEETKEKLRQANLGKVLSFEHKEKIKQKSNKRKIIVDGIEYESAMEFSRISTINPKTVWKRLKNKNFKNYNYLD
jgi:hypothetical protein